MRSFYARSVMIAVGAFCLANGVWAQAQYNAPSILPNAPARQLNPWAQSAGFRGMNSNYGGYSPQFYSVATPTEAPPPVPALPNLAAPEAVPGPNNPGQPQPQQPLLKPFSPQGQPQFQQQRQPYQNSYEQVQPGPGRFHPQFQQPYSQPYQPQYQPQPAPQSQQQPGSQYSPTPYDAAAQSPWSNGNYGGGVGGYSDGNYGGYPNGGYGTYDAYGSSGGYGGGYGGRFGGGYGGFGGAGGGNGGDWGGGSCCGNWFGGIGGMVMTRNHSNFLWLTHNVTDPFQHVLTNRDADMAWASGQQVMFGRYFNCGQNAIQLVYWGLNPGQAEGNAYRTSSGGAIQSILLFDDLLYNDGVDPVTPVEETYRNAVRHRLLTRNNFQNVELNLFAFSMGAGSGGGYRGAGGFGAGGTDYGGYDASGDTGYGTCSSCAPNGCGSRLRMSWLGGLRYFRFTDYFSYSADRNDGIFGNDENEISYKMSTVNNLFGFQLGGRLDYGLTRCWSLYAAPKMGLYTNRMTSRQHIGNEAECAYINDPASPYNGEYFDITARRNSIAFLGELDVGSSFRFSRCWSVSAGYRVVAVSGVALTTNQIPQSFRDLGAAQTINNNGDLILHGAYMNVNYNW